MKVCLKFEESELVSDVRFGRSADAGHKSKLTQCLAFNIQHMATTAALTLLATVEYMERGFNI